MDVPGFSVGIIYKDSVLLSSGYGVLEKGKNAKADQNTIYAIASNSKAFVSAALAKLVDEGKISWDDPVHKHLPYFELYDPCVTEMTTIADLLSHRTGLGTFSGDVIWYRSQRSPEEVVRKAVSIPKKFDFRNGFGYSNVMYIAAGEVIRAVTGMSWDQYVKKEFIDPLQMHRTLTSTTNLSMTTNVATPHISTWEGDDPTEWVSWDTPGAAGGILSSVDDMLKWMRLQLHNGIMGHDTFFTPAQQLQMWTPRVNFPVNDVARQRFGGRNYNGYGLGWGTTEYYSHQVISHTGGYDGMYSAVTLFPQDELGVVVLTNAMKGIGTLLAYEIADVLLNLPEHDWKKIVKEQFDRGQKERKKQIEDRINARNPGIKPTLSSDAIAGLYRCPMYGDITINNSANGLEIKFINAPELSAGLEHWQGDTYQIKWKLEQPWFSFGTVQVQQDNRGKPARLLFDVPNDDIFFEEIHAVRVP